MVDLNSGSGVKGTTWLAYIVIFIVMCKAKHPVFGGSAAGCAPVKRSVGR